MEEIEISTEKFGKKTYTSFTSQTIKPKKE